MRTLGLTTLGIGGLGTIAGTGAILNHYYGGDSIKQHIEKTTKTPHKIFLTSNTPNLSDIKAKYKASKRTKPQANGKAVEDTEIAKWCENAVNQKFWDEKSSNLAAILSWCYINTNDFGTDLGRVKKTLLSSNGADHQDWKTAWGKYKIGRDEEGLKIEESSYDDLNKDDETKGGQALHKWCNAKKTANQKLYEDGVEKDFSLFVKWCSKDS
ncbi:hypothetical protein A6V39_04440 [Candidatus Mycoplasma haematobovis]|uniref:Uncharacterized protein n=1 Tax=Candidatus Mycoplasma haematobovis TaxID=432608 RepID=A0A1A9QCG5_9MOLU|nr:hypothetical protein [Candidatus Mycoplasma haematobovis]OAL10133.1 hypothetical protein A6V39_04440 [Candidatus Mycoplasma haematobovis]